MVTPRKKKRNLPAINATIDEWQDDWLKSMQKSSGKHYSRLLREIISIARKVGYTPGNASIDDLRQETLDRVRKHPE